MNGMLKTASDYNALRALMGWSFGANDAQIGIVMPHLLAKYARSIRVKMPDGTFEGIGLGLLGNMQAVEAMHADLKLAMRALTNGHADCWQQLMQLDSISKVPLCENYTSVLRCVLTCAVSNMWLVHFFSSRSLSCLYIRCVLLQEYGLLRVPTVLNHNHTSKRRMFEVGQEDDEDYVPVCKMCIQRKPSSVARKLRCNVVLNLLTILTLAVCCLFLAHRGSGAAGGSAATAATAATSSSFVYTVGCSTSSYADLCDFCREVVRLHVVVLGRRTQGTWVAEVLEAHASGEKATKAAEEQSDQGGFEVVALATREVLEKLESLFEAVGEMEDDETAREVAQRVAEGVSAASLEAFVATRVLASSNGGLADDNMAIRKDGKEISKSSGPASTWLSQAFNERSNAKACAKTKKKTTRNSTSIKKKK